MINKKGATSALLITIVVAIVAIAIAVSYQAGLFDTLLGVEESALGPAGSGDNANVAVNPAAAYSTKDAFATTTVTGTTYYKVGTVDTGTPASTTAISNVNPGSQYTYWIDNTTHYFVKPTSFIATTLNNVVVNDKAYQNGSVTLTGYDLTDRVAISGTSHNVSLGANEIGNIEATYQGIAKKTSMPFGGIMVFEINSTVSLVTCSGEGITTTTPFHITYTPTYTTHKAVIFGVTEALDTGVGKLQRITCQLQNGAVSLNAADTSFYKISMFPANYYLTNDGNIALDVEKFENDATTKTSFNGVSSITPLQGNWTA